MFETKLDCQLVQVLMFVVVFADFCPLFEQGAGWLFEFISISEYDCDLTSRQSSCVIVHDM